MQDIIFIANVVTRNRSSDNGSPGAAAQQGTMLLASTTALKRGCTSMGFSAHLQNQIPVRSTTRLF